MEDDDSRLPIAALVLLASLVFAVLRQGAYHQWQHQVFAVLVGAAGGALLTNKVGIRALRLAALVVSPLLVSSVISAVAASDRSDARSTILEIAMVGIGLAVGFRVQRSHQDAALGAVVAIALLVAATAIWGVAAHSTPWGRITEGVWRGSSSLTYANAAAAVTGPIALMTFSKASTQDNRWNAVASVGLLIGFASTQSRAGALAFLVIGILVIAHLGRRAFAETALPVAAGVSVGLPLLLLRSSATSPSQPVLVLAAVVAGLAVTWLLWPRRKQIARPDLVLAAFVSVAVVGAFALGAMDAITERLTLRSGTTAGGEQAGVLFGDRAKEWSAAWDQVTDAPVLGHGPGNVDLRWIEDGRGFQALFVHNEYLEFAVTNGALGLIALVLSAALLLRTIDDQPAKAAVFLACAAFLLHSTFDFLWHLPALPVLFAFIVGTTVSGPTAPSLDS